jgi:hypothetical protein
MNERAVWEGTASELLAELKQAAELGLNIDTKDRSWPKAANSLTKRLNVLKPNLRRIGILIDSGKDAKGRSLIIRKANIGDDTHDDMDGRKNRIVIEKTNNSRHYDDMDGYDGCFPLLKQKNYIDIPLDEQEYP